MLDLQSSVFRRLDALEEVASRREKVRLIKSFKDQALLHQIFDAALNPFTHFGIGELTLPPAKKVGRKKMWMDNEMALKVVLLAKDFSQSHFRKFKLDVVADLAAQCNPLQQKWLERILLKELRCGVSIKTVNQCSPEFKIPVFELQAATLLKHVKDFKKLSFPQYVAEPKLNGLRFIRYKGTACSRSGHALYNLDFLLEQVGKLTQLEDYIIDGEFVSEDWSKSMSFARSSKTKQTDQSKASWYIFDAIHKDEFLCGTPVTPLTERKNILREAFSGQHKIGNLVRVPTVSLNSHQETLSLYQKMIDRGYEGLMLKKKDSVYTAGRNKNWIKMKPEETVDLEIVGFKPGQGKYRDTLGAIIVEKDGETTAVSGMTEERRNYIWENRAALIGTVVEVKYMELTPDGKLLLPRFVKLRPDQS